jgi:O-antigen/teichoic acid export membrane protein
MVFLFINLTMSFTLAVKYGVNIFAISFVTASLVQVFLLFAFIGNFVDLHFRFLINRTLRIVFGSAVMGTVVYLIRDFSGFGVWFTTGLSVMVGVIVYFIVMHFLDMLRYAGLKRIGISFKSLFRK